MSVVAIFEDGNFQRRVYYNRVADVPNHIWHYTSKGYPYRRRRLKLKEVYRVG